MHEGKAPNITTATAGSTITGPGGTLNYSLYSDTLRTTPFVLAWLHDAGGARQGPSDPDDLRPDPRRTRTWASRAFTGNITVTVNF